MILAWLFAAHVCSAGPVTLSMTLPLDCEVTPDCTIEQPMDDAPEAYRTLCPCQLPGFGYWIAEYELWTDYPECEGHKL